MERVYECFEKLATGADLNFVFGFQPQKIKVVSDALPGVELNWQRLSTKASTYSGVWAAPKGILSGPVGSGLLKSPAPGIGSTTDQVATGAFNFMINGVTYHKAAVAAGTAPAATTVPDGKFGLFGFEIGADGTIDNNDAADNATGYATAALALAALPDASANHTMIAYIIVEADGADFVGATTALSAATVNVTYYVPALKGLIASDGNGIKVLEDSNGRGITIEADGVLNVSGNTLRVEGWR